MARKATKTVRLEFPVLIYRDDNGWVAQSILTCTTAVHEDQDVALSEVCRLLQAELEEAMRLCKGDVGRAIEIISCPAPDNILRMYFTQAEEIDPPANCPTVHLKRSGSRTLLPITFTPREVAFA